MTSNLWRTISGAICMNISMTSMHKFHKTKNIDDLFYPLYCALYLSLNWDRVCFSKQEKIEEYIPYVSADVNYMKNILLANQHITFELIQTDKKSGYLGSYTFTNQVMYLMKIANNKQLDSMNPLDFFQNTWEVLFWYVQGSKTKEQLTFLKLIKDFGEHELIFDQTIKLINDINEVR